MTQEAWFTAHPYLLAVAEFHEQVEQAAADVPSALACIPNWRDYERDYVAGVPLLQSCGSTMDLKPAEITLEALIERVGLVPLPDKLAQDIRDLQCELHRDADVSQRAVAKLLDPDTCNSMGCGLLHRSGAFVFASRAAVAADAR